MSNNSGKIPGTFREFLLNFTLIDHSYNGAWWYMSTYIVITLLSPIIIKLFKVKNNLVLFLIGLSVYTVSFYIRFYVDTDNWLLLKIGPFGMTLFEYIIGVIFAKYKFITKIRDNSLTVMHSWKRPVLSVIILIVLMYVHTRIIATLYIAPLTGLMIIVLFLCNSKPKVVKSILIFISKHSTNIWLVHMFFINSLYRNLVYQVKYPILIFAFEMLLCIMASILLLPIEEYNKKRIASII